MAQETQDLGKQAVDIGMQLYLLYVPRENDDINKKTLQLAFEFFKQAALRGNISGKVLAAYLGGFLPNIFLVRLNPADVEEIKRRANASGATDEDKRNLWLCAPLGLADNELTEFPLDDLFMVHHAVDSSPWIMSDDQKIAAANRGILAAAKRTEIENVCREKALCLCAEREDLVAKASAMLKAMEEAKEKEIKAASFETTLCSPDLPTEVQAIIHHYLSKIMATSLGNFLASTRQPVPPEPPASAPQERQQSGPSM